MSTWCKAHGHWTSHKVRLGVCTEDYPTHSLGPMFCDCPVYVPQPIPLFHTSQCAGCGRPRRGAT